MEVRLKSDHELMTQGHEWLMSQSSFVFLFSVLFAQGDIQKNIFYSKIIIQIICDYSPDLLKGRKSDTIYKKKL